MRTVLSAGLALAAGLGMASTAVAQDDDWEFQQDTARNITVAAARYDAGQMIVAQCREGALTLVVAGLRGEADKVEVQAARADGRHDIQEWRSAGAQGAFRSAVPARDLRFLRGGGTYTVQTAEGAEPAFAATFDLPTESANLDRVLTACGWALTDERDLLARGGSAVSFTDPAAEHRFSQPRPSRSVQSRNRVPPPPPPPTPGPAEQQISCIVRDLKTADCRADHPPAAGGRVDEAVLRRFEGRQLYAADAAAAEGKVVYISRSGVTVVID
jgi:hypothetical protein